MIVRNPTSLDTPDYPIQNPQTKEVHMWSIKAGQTLDFPDYVGQYLLEIYGFLQRVVTEDELKREAEEKKKLAAGRHFEQTVVLKSQGKKVAAPQVPSGLTNELKRQQPTPHVPVKDEVPQAPPSA